MSLDPAGKSACATTLQVRRIGNSPGVPAGSSGSWYQVPVHRSPDIAEEGSDVGRLLGAHQDAPAVTQGILQFAGNHRDVSGDSVSQGNDRRADIAL